MNCRLVLYDSCVVVRDVGCATVVLLPTVQHPLIIDSIRVQIRLIVEFSASK